MYEKRLPAVSPQSFTSDGTTIGTITIANASLFKVKQKVLVRATSLSNLQLEIKRIEEDGVTIHLGPPKTSITQRTDLSEYTLLLSATIEAAEQERPIIPEQEVERLTYEEEPVVARRVVVVDKVGKKVDDTNPLPVSNVQLFTKKFDAITAEYPSDTQEIYKSRVGGISGEVQETVTIVYTDSTKNLIASVVRT